ncbi:aldo/keto reductase family oxidoreductase [Sungkyunkwania multivorans]|uniref:Aldo/keto reductase family oxidoreductase n=1 Tax=Sungkyunkwania multivorans TaxID=1173618 RepID=A0ABW3D1V7_9FLAO
MKNKKYSRIIAGTMTWGSWGKNLDLELMVDLIHHCVSQGIHTFDHADIYGGYTTEEAFGRALSKSGISRDSIQLISKCGIQYICEKRPNGIKHYDYRKSYIIGSVEESLKNLQTEYLDLLLLHRPSPLMHPDEIGEAVEQLKTQGKIVDFGVSNFTPSQMQLIDSGTSVAVNQIEFSLTAHNAMHDGTLDHMILHGITPMAWSPLGTVFREENDQTHRIHQQLMELMPKYNATADQLLLAWILQHPSSIHPVIGTTGKDRIINAVNALKIELELEDWFSLLVASQGHKVP